MKGNPITTPIHCDVLREGPSVHPPHVIITLNKRPIQTLLLNESEETRREG